MFRVEEVQRFIDTRTQDFLARRLKEGQQEEEEDERDWEQVCKELAVEVLVTSTILTEIIILPPPRFELNSTGEYCSKQGVRDPTGYEFNLPTIPLYLVLFTNYTVIL